MFLQGILLVLVGTFMIVKPDWFWLITESWKSSHSSEPSLVYRWYTKEGGMIFLIIGISGIIGAFMK